MTFAIEFARGRHLVTVLLLALLATAPARAGTGAVAMPDLFSAEAAAQVLRGGGNAVNAAISAAFVQAVTCPGAAAPFSPPSTR